MTLAPCQNLEILVPWVAPEGVEEEHEGALGEEEAVAQLGVQGAVDPA